MKFVKMQGIGNDYIYVNCLEEVPACPSETAIRLSDRHFGVGGDGVILIRKSSRADFFMDMYNADGSTGKMCGNGIRCVAKFVYDFGLTDKTELAIDTRSGIRHLKLNIFDGKVASVQVDMGSPILNPEDIPVLMEGETCIGKAVTINGTDYEMTCVSMGNPHAVVFVDDVTTLRIEETGPQFENHKMFPDRVNTEFVHVISRDCIAMRVWERGSGETLACGTGACASVVASILNGFTDELVTVQLRGGDLQIYWNRKENTVYMTGSAEIVFTGEAEVEMKKDADNPF